MTMTDKPSPATTEILRGIFAESRMTPEWSACFSSHQEIRYTGERCPLCEAALDIEALHLMCQGVKHYSQCHKGDCMRCENERLREALTRLRDCDWIISLPDRMDAVRDIARDALSRPSEAPAPKPCFCGGRAVLGPIPQDGTDAEVQYVHATGCPRDVGPGAGEEGK